MKRTHLILVAVFSLGYLNAQSIVSLNQTLGYGQTHAIFAFNDRYDGLDGNPYFYDDKFHDGELWLTKNRHYEKAYKYRFDQVTNSLQLQSSDGKEILLDANDILTFNLFIDDKTVSFARLVLPNSKAVSMVQIIYWSPKLKLIRDVKKKLIRNKENNAYNDGKVTDKVINDYSYYISKGSGELIFIKPSKKGLMKALPEKEAEIERLFKTKEFKDDLTISKLADLMVKLNEEK